MGADVTTQTIQLHNQDVRGQDVAELASQSSGRTPITTVIEGAIAAMVRSGWTNDRIVDFLASNRRTYIAEGDVERVRVRVPEGALLPATNMETELAGATVEVDVMLKMAQTIRTQESRLSAALQTEERIANTGGDELMVPGKPGVVRRQQPGSQQGGQSGQGGQQGNQIGQASVLSRRPARRGGFAATVNEMIAVYWSMLTQYTRAAQSMGKLPNHVRGTEVISDLESIQLPSLRTLVQHNVTINNGNIDNLAPPQPVADVTPPEATPVDVIDGSFTVQDLGRVPDPDQPLQTVSDQSDQSDQSDWATTAPPPTPAPTSEPQVMQPLPPECTFVGDDDDLSELLSEFLPTSDSADSAAT